MSVPWDAVTARQSEKQSGTQDRNKWKNWEQVEAFVPKLSINKKLYESGKKSSDTSRHAAVLKSTARAPLGSAKWEKKSFSTEELNLQFPK